MKPINIPEIDTFSFYRSIISHPIMVAFSDLMAFYAQNGKNLNTIKEVRNLYYDFKAKILAYAFDKDEAFQYAKTPWKDLVISCMISDENPLTLLMERSKISRKHPFYNSMLGDYRIFYDLYHFDWQAFLAETQLDNVDFFEARVFFPVAPCDSIYNVFEAGKDFETVFEATSNYVREHGLGIFENNSCFAWNAKTGHLSPVHPTKIKPLSQFVGYDRQKQELLHNTTAFVDKGAGLNVLLQGAMGTGKSSMVKALLHEFKGTRLRMIALRKDDLENLSAIMDEIKDRPYPFIIYVDDLSFAAKDDGFKWLKHFLEGSLNDCPENVRFYATSNQRHLVEENFSEREDAVHAGDVMEEKLSLSSRFGLVLSFVTPNQEEYLHIVNTLVAEAGIEMHPAKLRNLALQWELRHLNRSGRTAVQFVEYLKGQEDLHE